MATPIFLKSGGKGNYARGWRVTMRGRKVRSEKYANREATACYFEWYFSGLIAVLLILPSQNFGFPI